MTSDVVVLARRASFAPEPASAGAARRLLQEALDAAQRQQWAESGGLALSEVVTNAVLHAHTSFDVLIEVFADRLRVEVRDGNPALPHQPRYDEQATTGRGMALVAAMTDECGVHSLGGEGKTVWFSLSGQAPAQLAEELLDAWDLDGDWEQLGQVAADGRAVLLQAVPAALWMAARQHHNALLRELVLYVAEHTDAEVDLALADAARAYVSSTVLQAIEQAPRSTTEWSVLSPTRPWPPAGLSVDVTVPGSAGPAFAALQDALDVAERLAAGGRLLVRPGLPEIVAVRDWVCEQVVAQLAGAPPSPWPGTAQQRFETAVHTLPDEDLTWDDTQVRDADRGVVAADDANRIVAVSRPLAALLGWQPVDLVGRRVVTLVPPRLREAHVAGFSRHLTTGEAHILGVPVIVPVLHADGHELTCRMLIERAPQSGGRSVYLAWIEPTEQA